MIKNLLDAADVAVHPDMIDPYTKHPTLAEEEYRRKVDHEHIPTL